MSARIPKPNDNVIMGVGHKTLVDAVFSDTGLNGFLDGLKRSQGESISNEVKASVANSVEMMGISIDKILSNDDIRAEYGFGGKDSEPIYHAVDLYDSISVYRMRDGAILFDFKYPSGT